MYKRQVLEDKLICQPLEHVILSANGFSQKLRTKKQYQVSLFPYSLLKVWIHITREIKKKYASSATSSLQGLGDTNLFRHPSRPRMTHVFSTNGFIFQRCFWQSILRHPLQTITPLPSTSLSLIHI